MALRIIEDSPEDESQSGRASAWALVVFVPWMFVIWFCLHDWYQEVQLGKRAMTTSGMIVKIEHENHGQYDYEYSVSGTTYKGAEILAGASLGVGQHVQVSYIPDAPQKSTLTRFGEIGTRPVPVLFFTLIACYAYFRLRRLLMGPANPYNR
jgi:Protein of unknown function (DUF3592)